ncbi:Crp/Fnr family transcriptional regulator [Tenacibaculum sp. TC6]|uniref:Crp/Fnr family transcriptional regulator n=1 Tax=Tenacibaculum sp. TC6 TaxID=3423223 RepID=UPI003D35F489
MQNIIEQFMRYFIPNISEKSIESFSSIVSLKQFPKGKIIIKQGQVPSNFYIIKSGVARSYIKNEEEKEHIRTLYTPLSTVGALSSLIKKNTSNATYDCLTDCEFFEGDFSAFLNLTQNNHEIALFYCKVLESIFIRTEKRVDELALLSATERYLKLKEEIPEINNLIPQYHIASFLNITPVQLSRIRKKLYSV